MPYEWVKQIEGAAARSAAPSAFPPAPASGGDTLAELHLWPYRSLPKRGYVWFIAATAAFLFLPLLDLLGSPIVWGLLPFLILAGGGLWYALGRSYRDGEVIEELTLSHDSIRLTRHNPRAPRQEWEANPYWVSLQIHPTGGPVPDYLTLKGAGREVELGAFLTPGERTRLRGELAEALARVKSA